MGNLQVMRQGRGKGESRETAELGKNVCVCIRAIVGS